LDEEDTDRIGDLWGEHIKEVINHIPEDWIDAI